MIRLPEEVWEQIPPNLKPTGRMPEEYYDIILIDERKASTQNKPEPK